ncbi:HelD family protein [Pedobacter sp. BS3]|uniref:HelD family protein n=1 Tax=Pedobacter sp. BS3 TaxID=2567937 RepID=UPI00165997AF|nr:UvrD-helicase domain-containing protein [Pedobacter sp. BS3]
MMKINTEQDEQKHLQEVKTAISDKIKSIRHRLQKSSDEMAEYKEYLRENKDEKAILHQSVSNTAISGEASVALLKQLNRLYHSPYFGRIDFQPITKDNEEIVYIGICNFIDEESKINLMFDWRAPISSMFYDFEKGNALYEAPSGTVAGNINLKRQYKIRNGEMEFMLDTSAHIYDELLQKELSLKADEKMKSIIATIQKDQNAIIRNESSNTLIIQGVAGSGKTSIALHRVAFMLYRFRETITSANILILSPNKVFSDYISNVLPELGEENIPEKTIVELINDFLEYQYVVQSLFAQVSFLLNTENKSFAERVNFKSSEAFVKKLDEYIAYLNSNYFTAKDIKIGKYIIPQEIVDKEYKSLFRLSLLKRIKELENRLTQHLFYKHRYEVSSKDKAELKKAINNMSGTKNIKILYKNFYVWLDRKDLLKPINNKDIEYLDAFGLAYLKINIDSYNADRQVKHLVIDEMQDYAPIQFAVIKKLFNCKITLLGDINQSLNPQSQTNLQSLQKSFPQSQLMTLNKSYRSTFEIINFTQRIAFNEDIIPIERHGKSPIVYNEKDIASEKEQIIALATQFLKDKTFHSLAIICKTEKEAEDVKCTLDDKQINAQYLSSESTRFTDGVIVTSAQLAKGLEFDVVIVPFVNNANYKNDIDRSMLYIACTRAMQELILTHSNEVSDFIKETAKE